MDLFRERLENILNRRHELCRLAEIIDWSVFEKEFGKLYAPKKGRPGIPIRLMVGLSYLGHAYDLSDEAVVVKWVENPYGNTSAVKRISNINCPLLFLPSQDGGSVLARRDVN